MRKSFAAAAAFILVLGGSIAAANAGWTVARSSGQVFIGVDGPQKISLRPNEDLPGGATVTTGVGGRVLLTRNKEVMTIGPNTVVMIPADDASGFTTILQKAGQVEFEVEKRNVRHFQVNTPFLAAVVKGTHFVVSVNRSGASVSVSRGRVGVTDNASGQQADILPGQSAKASTSGGLVVAGTPGQGKANGKAKNGNNGIHSESWKTAGKSASAGSNGNSGSGNNGNGNGNGNSGSGNSGGGNSGSGNSGSGNSGSGSGNSGSGNSGSGSSGSGGGGGSSGSGGGDD